MHVIAMGENACMAEAIRISFWMFLRAMAAVAWSAFRHPLSTSVIDVTTGECVERWSGETTIGSEDDSEIHADAPSVIDDFGTPDNPVINEDSAHRLIANSVFISSLAAEVKQLQDKAQAI